MWKKLVSLNLALLMCFALMPSASAEYLGTGYFKTIFHQNVSDSDTETKSKDWDLSSFSDLRLYAVETDFENSGHVITSYKNAAGRTFSLTDWITDVMKDAQTSPANVYAQWTPARDNYILYIGLGANQTPDGKDYILVDDLRGTVNLKGADAFPSSQIIGWASDDFLSSSTGMYYPGQEITIDSNLTLFPITGYNYVTYHFYVELNPEMVEETEFYTVGSSDSDKPVGMLKISDDVFENHRKGKRVFLGWAKQTGGAAEWYTGPAKNAPQHDLYGCYKDYPSEDFCILRSPLGFEGDADDQRGGLNRTHPLVNKHATGLPMFTSTRYGYEFKGWYADKNYTQAVTDDREFSRGDILYAKWVKVADPPEDKTYTIIIDGGSSVTTGSDGKLTALPAAPTKPGYIFNGWYTGPDGTGTKVTTGYIFTGPTTIYPYWKPESSQPSDKVYVIIIDGGNSVTTGSDGKLTALPTAPTKPGYIFDGWYTQPDSGDRVTTDYIFTGPITIYPHWRPASSSTYYRVYTPDYIRGGSLYVSHNYALPGTQVTVEVSPRRDYYLDWLAVTNLSTGRDLYLTEYDWDEYTFTMPSSDVEVDLSYLDDYYSPSYYSPYTSGGYVSVTQTQVDSKPVQWYYSGGSIYHVTDGLVPTGALLTRDMLLSVLYNMDDTSSGGPIFWASKNHIVPDIYESWLWGVDKSITREQAAMILYCYAQHKGYSTFQRATITGYPDYNQIRSAARPAMSWAQASGLLTDFSSRALSPRNTLTCGQANSMLYRFVSNVTWGR